MEADPTTMTLAEWLRRQGTVTGTFTYNGITYSNLAEVEWRTANGSWSA